MIAIFPPPAPRARPQHIFPQGSGPARQRHGFTLVELLVAMGVAAIILTAAVPSFSSSAASYRILNEANGLARDLQFARSEAIKRGQAVSVCPSTDGASCLANSTAWQGGWLVFYDSNGSGIVTASDTILRWQAQNPGTVTFLADNNVSVVTFNRQGAISALPANPVTLTLHAPNTGSGATRCLALTPSGRASVETAGIGNCT